MTAEPTPVPAYPRLFEPYTLGKLKLANRLVVLPHGTSMVHEGGITQDDIAYYEARAKSGPAMIITGAAIVHPTSALRSRKLVKPYNEDAWVRLGDTARTPVETSLALLDALHSRWVTLLEVMTAEDFMRPLTHPDGGAMTLDRMLQLYAWHGPHHVAHVTALRARKGWESGASPAVTSRTARSRRERSSSKRALTSRCCFVHPGAAGMTRAQLPRRSA